MNIIILTNEPFPIGMAATNRILSYSKGIVELGNSLEVICLRPTEIEYGMIRNQNVKGQYNGIKYEYVSGTTIWPKSGKKKLKKLLYILKGLFNSIKLIKKINNLERVDCLLLYSNSFINIVFFYFVSRFINTIYIQEKNEYPFILYKKSIVCKLYANFYVNHIYKLFDGMIIMTNYLMEYFQNKIRKNSKLCLVPMTVETERFSKNKIKINEKSRYIAYCGSPYGNKDGVPILIKAFSIISKKHRSIKLYIIGDSPRTKVLQELRDLTKKLNIEHRVVFTGSVTRNKMPEYICSASILALSRPTSLQAKYGFPTKLGEYLSTGNPVVVTKVGEIHEFLTDGENAFLSEPDSAETFAEKLDYVLLHPELAKKVGLKGREVALKHFNYKTQAKRIINFIDELNQR